MGWTNVLIDIGEVRALDSRLWHGALAFALLEGQESRKAVRFANAAASIKCSRLGGALRYSNSKRSFGIPLKQPPLRAKSMALGFGRLRTADRAAYSIGR